MCHLKITLLNYAAYEVAATESWLTQDYKEKKKRYLLEQFIDN